MPPKGKRPRPEDDIPEEFDDRSHATSDEEGEDLFGEDYIKDYIEPSEESDVEDDVLNDFIADDDESTASSISDTGRMAVNAMLERREALQRKLEQEQKRPEEAMFSDDDDELFSQDEDDMGTENGEESVPDEFLDDDEFADPDDRVYVQGELDGTGFNWKHPQGELVEWLSQEIPRQVIKNRMYNFFLNYVEDGIPIYASKVTTMTRENDMSFQLSYRHLSRVYESVLALWLVDAPDPMIELLEDAANYFTFKQFPNYKKVHSHIFIRVCDLPLCDPIRDFRQVHMNVLVRVEGVVIRRSPVYPQMHAVKYDCLRCSYIIGPIYQRGDKEQRVNLCPSCHSKGPFKVNMVLTEYRNHQTIVLQESPGKVPPGRLPRSLEVVLTNDLIDIAKPGEEVDVTGIYRNSFWSVL
ncbi:hypothetical protein AGDE_04741 [Angomonas deanei]|nr:hypothetical protein AGDE_04741 [Angomonas deanei]|eukprot:EPY39187.1 hypothetical protein AGDE_04741 [Angomonas deanei]